MATSSKGRASSRKQSSAGKARVISAKRKDALPRTGSVSAGRRKPVVLPPIDALTEPLVTPVAAPKKKARTLHHKESTASRKKTTRAAGGTSAKLDELAMEVAKAVIARAIEPAMVTAPEPVAETVGAAEPPASAYEEFVVSALEAPEVAALAVVDTELEVEASAIVEELPFEAATAARIAIAPPPIPEETRAPQLFGTTAAIRPPVAPAPHHERRSLMPAISRLVSTLVRWTGVSGPR